MEQTRIVKIISKERDGTRKTSRDFFERRNHERSNVHQALRRSPNIRSPSLSRETKERKKYWSKASDISTHNRGNIFSSRRGRDRLVTRTTRDEKIKGDRSEPFDISIDNRGRISSSRRERDRLMNHKTRDGKDTMRNGRHLDIGRKSQTLGFSEKRQSSQWIKVDDEELDVRGEESAEHDRQEVAHESRCRRHDSLSMAKRKLSHERKHDESDGRRKKMKLSSKYSGKDSQGGMCKHYNILEVGRKKLMDENAANVHDSGQENFRVHTQEMDKYPDDSRSCHDDQNYPCCRRRTSVHTDEHGRRPFPNTQDQGVPGEEQLKLFTTEQKEDIASTIFCTLCESYDGTSDLKSLCTTLLSNGTIRFSNSRSLHHFMKEFENVFQIAGVAKDEQDTVEDGELEETPVEDNYVVTAKPNLQLCIAHSTKAGSCIEGCRGLHICKYFIMSQCVVASTGIKCLFGHDMATEHNKTVMRKALIHMFPSAVLLKLKYRNSTTAPVICRFYNRQGCQKPVCQFLHVCRKYIQGTCESGLSCNCSHELRSDPAYTILSRYGMAPLDVQMEQELIQTLGTIDSSNIMQSPAVQTPSKQESITETKTSKDTSSSADSDDDKAEDLESTSPWDWDWGWQAEDGKWTSFTDSHNFEERYREYIQAQKMQFSIDNKISEINFATMKGRIMGETPLKFKRVKNVKIDAQT